MKPPKCKLCGTHHWLNEPHVFKVTANVTQAPISLADVTPVVTAYESVTGSVTVTAGVTHEYRGYHDCPVCGLRHRAPLTNAQRQAAYRKRLKEEVLFKRYREHQKVIRDV